jgi:hypothetical protein
MRQSSDVAISVSLMYTIHLPCVLTAKLSSLLCGGGNHRHHRGRNQHSNHIVQSSDPFLLQLSISAWLTSRYNDHHNFLSTSERDRVRFLLFCSVWSTFLSPILPVLVLLEWAQFMAGLAAHVILCAIFISLRSVLPSILISGSIFLSWVFWLSGAAAITESLGGGLNCEYVARTYIYTLSVLTSPKSRLHLLRSA